MSSAPARPAKQPARIYQRVDTSTYTPTSVKTRLEVT